MPFDAIIVLGCRVNGLAALSPPAGRRVARAAQAYRDGMAPVVVTSGGKRWRGVREAYAFAEQLVTLGVPREHILCEAWSLTTVQNARFVAELVCARGMRELALVTCDWHMARAVAAFGRHGLAVHAVPAPAPTKTGLGAVRRSLGERTRAVFDRVLFRADELVVRASSRTDTRPDPSNRSHDLAG